MGARKKTTRVQNLRADELVKLIFTPVTDGKRLSGPARTAHVRFVEALLAATIGVGEKFQQLLEDGRRHTAKRRKRKATTQPRVDSNDFGRELMGALANCWGAYRSAANPLISLS